MWWDAHSSVVKDILKQNELCTILSFSLFVWLTIFVFICLIIKTFNALTKVGLDCNYQQSNPQIHFLCLLIKTSISEQLSSILRSHHITFLWGSLPLLPSNWLSFSPYGTMYSVIVQCNACTFYSLLVLLFIFSNTNSKPNLLQYQKESHKLHFGLCIFQLNSFDNLNITQIIIQSSQLIHN